MNYSEFCNGYPKEAFGSELAPESFLVSVHSSALIESSAKKIINLINTFGIALVEFEEEETPQQQLLCFKLLFGEIVYHDRSDHTGIAEVAVIDESSVYPGVSSREYTFHTDGSYDENPPKVVALRCQIPARRGGVTQLASGKSLHDWLLSQDKDALDVLYTVDALSIQRAVKSFSGAIFRVLANNRVAVRYRADEAVLVSSNEKVEKAKKLIQEFLSNEENLVTFQLKSRQVLLTDNFTILHGRTSFDSDDPRTLHRLWFDGMSSTDKKFCAGFVI